MSSTYVTIESSSRKGGADEKRGRTQTTDFRIFGWISFRNQRNFVKRILSFQTHDWAWYSVPLLFLSDYNASRWRGWNLHLKALQAWRQVSDGRAMRPAWTVGFANWGNGFADFEKHFEAIQTTSAVRHPAVLWQTRWFSIFIPIDPVQHFRCREIGEP